MGNITVVIPSRNTFNLSACVDAVRQNDNCDIIVVWDRSRGNDGLIPFWELPPVRVIPVNEDFIFARNCNIGIKAAPANHDIVLLNDDALLRTKGGFTQMQAALINPQIGIVGAVTNVAGQPLQMPHGIGLREVSFFAFVCVLIRRTTINRVGLLDERYCIDYGVEDNDYCEAVKRAGLKCAVYDHCFVDHSSLISTYRGDPHGYRSFAQNQKLFCEKWGITQ
jgi:GT2 family glycosyltransferase